MLIKESIGNIAHTKVGNRNIDLVCVEWFEVNKRILHKKTINGVEVIMKFMQETHCLRQGDILWQDDENSILIDIRPCNCIVIISANVNAAVSVAYEIGNRHLPLFYEGDDLIVPYEVPFHNMLQSRGYEIKIEERKLINAFKTSVIPHLQVPVADSPLNKISGL